jgi:hypothetical protein
MGEEFGSNLKQNRDKIDELVKRRFFVKPSFEIYGGVAGIYDYGPREMGFYESESLQWLRLSTLCILTRKRTQSLLNILG